MTSSRGIPPFLRKLVKVTDSCPPHIGTWNEDGTQFIVTSSQFADVLREHFQGSLQTFVRQLHFYSFQKKDDGAQGIWTFSHPKFIRGQTELLSQIERKPNPKKKTKNATDASESDIREPSDFEDRIRSIELKCDRIVSLEAEVERLKAELISLKEVGAAHSMLSLAPEKKIKQEKKDGDEVKDEMLTGLNLSRPKKVTRLSSVDSLMELKDFPFEDTSSVGSFSREIIRELQTGIFDVDFDEIMPMTSKIPNDTVPSTPLNNDVLLECGTEKSSCKFNIPHNLQLEPGVTNTLLKQCWETIAKVCCPQGELSKLCPDNLRKLCDEIPHPQTLPPIEQCSVNQTLLPIVRDHITEKALDIVIMRAIRQVYEIYYDSLMKKVLSSGKRHSMTEKH